jgi:hypothetical protein
MPGLSLPARLIKRAVPVHGTRHTDAINAGGDKGATWANAANADEAASKRAVGHLMIHSAHRSDSLALRTWVKGRRAGGRRRMRHP